MSAPTSPGRISGSASDRNKSKDAVQSSLPEQILIAAQSGREVIQDFVPLAESLEWELGQQYLRERGNKAFISDASPVPFVINNDGTLSRNAAELFFASLAEADAEGTLEPDIFVLELGIGVGLFARFFLDSFQELCLRHKKDYYDRLCYIAADRSEQMLRDACRHGIFANHAGRYRVRIVDALCPDKDLPYDVAFRGLKGKPLRGVFLNYLLDCLPAAALRFEGDQIKQLCVRTCVARTVKLEEFTDLTPNQLRERAKAKDPRSKAELLEVYGLFASEYDYRPVDASTLPYRDFALSFAKSGGSQFLLNYGAIQCLERLLELVCDDGFILMNEYGHTKMTKEDEFEHQRFSFTTAVGLNFPLLEAFFDVPGRTEWIKPPGDEDRGIHTRLLSKKLGYKTRVRFIELFNKAVLDQFEEPVTKARECLKVGRFELASSFYREALEKQPRNWVLLNEVANFLIFSLRDPKAGIDMAKTALALNPTCSSELWNTLGDGLYDFGRLEEAESAYGKALELNESDVRARFGLVWTYAQQKKFPESLAMIAEALSLDKTGAYRDRLLQKQQEVLAHLALKHQREYLLLTNLVSKYAKQPDKEKPRPEDSVFQQEAPNDSRDS